jgi:hypothetical protein
LLTSGFYTRYFRNNETAQFVRTIKQPHRFVDYWDEALVRPDAVTEFS